MNEVPNIPLKKEGFLSFRKKVSVEDLAQDNKAIKESVLQFTTAVLERFTGLESKLLDVSLELKNMKEVRNIPVEWEKTIKQMKQYYPELPDMATVYSVLFAYKNLNQKIGEERQNVSRKNLLDIRKDIIDRKIVNCSLCKRPLQEGEYYIFEGKKFCIDHKDQELVSSEESL